MSSRAIKKVLQSEGYDDLQANILRIEQLASQKAAAAKSNNNESQNSSGQRGFASFDLLEGLEENKSQDDSDSPEFTVKQKKKKSKAKKNDSANAFALLNADLGGDDQAGSDEEADSLTIELGFGHKGNPSENDQESQVEEPNVDKREKSSKKQKKKQNKKPSKKQPSKGSGSKKVNSMNLDQLEKHINDINSASGKGLKGSSEFNEKASAMHRKAELTRLLIGADIRNMNAEEEIKKLFGNDYGNVVKKDRRERMYRLQPGLERNRYIFAKPGLTWPPMKRDNGLSIDQIDLNDEKFSGLKLKALENGDNGEWYNVAYSKRYKSTQIEFYLVLNTHDPRAIQGIIYHHPYHVDGLLQFALSMEQSGATLEEVSEYIDRALFALETSFGTGFSFTTANCRLDYRRAENRMLFVSLFRQVTLLSKRGCWRSALEISKALLGLDPAGDPMGVVLLLDYIAIKAKKYSYVKEFFEKWPWSPTKLPNWMYSVATAEFLQELGSYKSNKSKDNDNTIDPEMHKESLKLLVRAILAFPTAIPKLLAKASIAISDKISNHSYFKPNLNSHEQSSTHLEILTSIFAERNSSLYRSREAAQWLNLGTDMAIQRYSQSVVQSVLRGKDGRPRIETSDREIIQGFKLEEKYVTYTVPYNVARHAVASDFTKVVASLPQDMIQGHSFAFDPLPPKDDINSISSFLEDVDMSTSGITSDLNVQEFINQLENYDNDDDLLGRIVRRIIPWLQRQPPDARIRDLEMQNVDSDDFDTSDDSGNLDTEINQLNLAINLDPDGNANNRQNNTENAHDANSDAEAGADTQHNLGSGRGLASILSRVLNPLRTAAQFAFADERHANTTYESENEDEHANAGPSSTGHRAGYHSSDSSVYEDALDQ